MIIRNEVIDYFREYENIPKDILEREIDIPLTSKFVISIIGPRRAGKTYLLFLLSKKIESPSYLNFEDTRLSEITYKELREIVRIFIEIYGKKPKYLLLDEGNCSKQQKEKYHKLIETIPRIWIKLKNKDIKEEGEEKGYEII